MYKLSMSEVEFLSFKESLILSFSFHFYPQLDSFFIIMKLIEGYYKAVGCYYQILKVNNQPVSKMLY